MNRRAVLSCASCGFVLVACLSGSHEARAVDPAVSAFLRNTDGATGQSPDATLDAIVSQIEADVQQVSYTDDSVYVETTGVPSYETGGFPDGNPNFPADVDAIYVIPLNPSYDDSANPTELGLGAMGIFVNGVGIFNAEDGVTYITGRKLTRRPHPPSPAPPRP